MLILFWNGVTQIPATPANLTGTHKVVVGNTMKAVVGNRMKVVVGNTMKLVGG